PGAVAVAGARAVVGAVAARVVAAHVADVGAGGQGHPDRADPEPSRPPRPPRRALPRHAASSAGTRVQRVGQGARPRDPWWLRHPPGPGAAPPTSRFDPAATGSIPAGTPRGRARG